MKTKEELKAEAIARGIKPGAVVRTEIHGTWTVPPITSWNDWPYATGANWGISCTPQEVRSGTWIYHCDDGWPTVITPAPEDQPQGLVDGMACEPDEHMRKAIVEKAKELGNNGPRQYYDRYLIWRNTGMLWQANKAPIDGNIISPGEFYDRLCKAVKPEPPIRIGDYHVTFNKGSIQVGCTEVPNDIVRQVAERLID